MRTLKRPFALLLSAIVGIVLLVFIVRDFFQLRALQSHGKTTVAQVTGAEERSGRRGRKKYYLSVNFKTEAGQMVTAEKGVSRSTYDQGSSAKSINIIYLPEKPEVFRI